MPSERTVQRYARVITQSRGFHKSLRSQARRIELNPLDRKIGLAARVHAR